MAAPLGPHDDIDIVVRLRDSNPIDRDLRHEAADEIDRLRARLRERLAAHGWGMPHGPAGEVS